MILLLIERYASRFHSSFVIACFLAVILDVVLAVICSISASLSIPEAKPPYPLKAVFPRLLLVLDTLDISAAPFSHVMSRST